MSGSLAPEAGFSSNLNTACFSMIGAEEGTRTPTPLRVRGPEPRASANSATSARETAQAGCAEQAATSSFANAATGVKFRQRIQRVATGACSPGLSIRFRSALKPARRVYTNFASSVISVLFANSFEIGQPTLASAAALSKTSLVAPGTLAVVVNAIFVIAKPASTLARVTAA